MKNNTKIKIFILFTLIISSGFALNVSAAELTATITYPNRCDDCPLGWVAQGGHADCSGGCPGGANYLYCKGCYQLDGALLPCGSLLASSYASYAAGFKATQVGWTKPLKNNGYAGAASTYPRTCKYNATPPSIACSSNSQCGTNGLTGSPFCQSGNVYQNYITYTCNNLGTASSSCSNSTTAQLQTTCSGSQTCVSGSCTNTCTSNYQQRCVGNNIYWYDSCGVQGSLIQYCSNRCSGSTCITNYCTQNSSQRCSGSNLYWYDSSTGHSGA